MGACYSCCLRSHSSQNLITPDAETRRRLQLEAVEKRKQEQEHRGIKDPEKLKRQQQKKEELEKLEKDAAFNKQGEGGLKWQMN
ncbi:hypothetical protein B566_EDAN015322 [Ephemera danica]|nr:hypothetical protein B566_EDAN015322 [Ephemera danica]